MDNHWWSGTKIKFPNDIARNKKFETKEKAEKERQIRIKRLLKGNSQDIKLAKQLLKCRKKNPCGKYVCPLCTRSFRRWLYAQERRLFRKSQNIRIVTIIMHNSLVKGDDLLSLSLPKLKNMLRTHLRRSKMANVIAVGGFELDYDEETQCWIPHFHIIMPFDDPEDEDPDCTILRHKYYLQKNEIKRPLKSQKVKDVEKQFSYCLKSYASCKYPYLTKKGKKRKGKKRLPDPYHNLALQFFAQYKPEELLFLNRVRRCGNELYDLALNQTR